MKTFIMVSEKPWHKELFKEIGKEFAHYDWIFLSKQEEFTVENISRIDPGKIFIPHWSYIIPSSIFEKYDCIVFHMTDLPFGRGGSPLQNLVTKGFQETKISALKVERGLDTGPIYLKRPLTLCGTAKEIFLRSNSIIGQMISEIISQELQPSPQEGEVVEFKRRKPEDGKMNDLDQLSKMYDFIRMLDCEGYPSAYIENENFRFEFSRASLKSEKEILADVRIIKK